ncbi:MAG: class I SAM-dependent methyltransferase [archaeon]
MKGYEDKWDELASRYRKYGGVPGKPNDHDGENFYKLSKIAIEKTGSKNPKVLLLGATPLVRDYLAKLDAEVTLIDLSKKMIKEMTKMCNHKKKENFVAGNWLDMPFKNHEFDVVVGDIVLPNVSIKNTDKFLKEVNRVLKPEGAFIQRMFFIPDDWEYDTTDKVMKRLEELDDSYDLKGELHSYMINNSYDEITHETSNKRIKNLLGAYWKGDRFFHNDKRVEKALNDFNEMWKPFDKKWSAGGKEFLFSMMEKEFKITKQLKGKGHTFEDTYIILECKPK